jgi:DNA-binding MarR family transcriptional regulator
VLSNAKVKDLGKVELRILNYIAEHGSINVTQAQKLLGAQGTSTNWHSVKRKFLEVMVAKGLLEREHSKVVQRDSRSRYVLAPLVSKATNGTGGPGKEQT